MKQYQVTIKILRDTRDDDLTITEWFDGEPDSDDIRKRIEESGINYNPDYHKFDYSFTGERETPEMDLYFPIRTLEQEMKTVEIFWPARVSIYEEAIRILKNMSKV